MMLEHGARMTKPATKAAARFTRTSLLALAAAGAAVCAAVQAQGFASRPILMTVGFAPSGGTDTAARIIARKLSDNLGKKQTVLLFFPLAYTSVCTQEMCDTTSGLGEYEKLGAAVIGISAMGTPTIAPTATASAIH